MTFNHGRAKAVRVTLLAAIIALPLLLLLRTAVSGPAAFDWEHDGREAWADSSRTVPADLAALREGQSAVLVVRARNVGSATWSSSGPNPLHLGTFRPPDRPSRFAAATWLAPNRPAPLREPEVPPGAVGTFEFQVVVPAGAGTFDEHFNLVVEGREWLDEEPGASFRLVVQ